VSRESAFRRTFISAAQSRPPSLTVRLLARASRAKLDRNIRKPARKHLISRKCWCIEQAEMQGTDENMRLETSWLFEDDDARQC